MYIMKRLLQSINAKMLTAVIVASGFAMSANAQMPYSADFESATCLPANKSYAATDTIDMNGVGWIMPGVYLGSMLTNDKYIDARSGRLRLTNNSSGDAGYIQMVEDFTSGVGDFSFSAAAYGTTSPEYDTLEAFYSIDAGTTWTSLGQVTTEDSMTMYTFTVNQTGNVRLKIQKANTDNKRSNIDNIYVTGYGSPTALSVLNKTPVGADIPLTTSDVTVKYNDAIAGATAGNLHVINVATNDTQTFATSSATLADGTATFSGLVLENASDYYVVMDADAFASSTDPTVTSPEIAGTTSWTFSTVDTTPAPIDTVLSTTFETCPTDDMSPFMQYSVTGSDIWDCSYFGHDDSTSVYINGGYAAGASDDNEDWLITTSKYDFSAMDIPSLSFWNKKRFDGDVVMSLKVSTDYLGSGDPNVATWTDVMTIAAPSGDDTWSQVSDIDLSAYKATPFFIAFVYECGTTGAYSYTLDDVMVENVTGIFTPKVNNTNLSVLGNPTSSTIKLLLNSNATDNYTIAVYDINGRTVFTHNYAVTKGDNNISLNNLNIASGMYFIKAYNANGNVGTAKAAVK